MSLNGTLCCVFTKLLCISNLKPQGSSVLTLMVGVPFDQHDQCSTSYRVAGGKSHQNMLLLGRVGFQCWAILNGTSIECISNCRYVPDVESEIPLLYNSR